MTSARCVYADSDSRMFVQEKVTPMPERKPAKDSGYHCGRCKSEDHFLENCPKTMPDGVRQAMGDLLVLRNVAKMPDAQDATIRLGRNKDADVEAARKLLNERFVDLTVDEEPVHVPIIVSDAGAPYAVKRDRDTEVDELREEVKRLRSENESLSEKMKNVFANIAELAKAIEKGPTFTSAYPFPEMLIPQPQRFVGKGAYSVNPPKICSVCTTRPSAREYDGHEMCDTCFDNYPHDVAFTTPDRPTKPKKPRAPRKPKPNPRKDMEAMHRTSPVALIRRHSDGHENGTDRCMVNNQERLMFEEIERGVEEYGVVNAVEGLHAAEEYYEEMDDVGKYLEDVDLPESSVQLNGYEEDEGFVVDGVEWCDGSCGQSAQHEKSPLYCNPLTGKRLYEHLRGLGYSKVKAGMEAFGGESGL